MPTRIAVAEFPDEQQHWESAWRALIVNLREHPADLLVLPELPFVTWRAFLSKKRLWIVTVNGSRTFLSWVSVLSARQDLSSEMGNASMRHSSGRPRRACEVCGQNTIFQKLRRTAGKRVGLTGNHSTPALRGQITAPSVFSYAQRCFLLSLPGYPAETALRLSPRHEPPGAIYGGDQRHH